jgi:flagellar biogenesis protein FliO
METLRQISAIVLVFGLLGLGVWALRRRSGPLRFGPLKSLASVERLSLTPHHAVHLIHIGGRELLIATHPNGLTLLTENTSPLTPKIPDLPAAPLRLEEHA